MSTRRFTALGTASQVPTTNRNQHASFLKWDKDGFLFDPGEGTQRQMIFSGISATEITKIFITHFHGDHCLGLSSVLQRLSLDRVPHPVQIYFPASGKRYFQNIQEVASYYNAAFVEPHPIYQEGIIFSDDTLIITAQRLKHGMETFGYRIEERNSVNMIRERLEELEISGPTAGELKEKGSIIHNGKMIHLEDVSVVRRGQSFAFIMDTAMCDAALSLAKDVDMLVTESTFLQEDEDKAAAYNHLTASQAAQLARKAKAGMLLLTHFSQRYGPDADFAAEARAIHHNVLQLHDGATYELIRHKHL